MPIVILYYTKMALADYIKTIFSFSKSTADTDLEIDLEDDCK